MEKNLEKCEVIIKTVCQMKPILKHVDQNLLMGKLSDAMPDTCTPKTMSMLLSEIASSLAIHHYEYNLMSGRVIMISLHSTTSKTFSNYVKLAAHTLSEEIQSIVDKNTDRLNAAIDDAADYHFDSIGLRTLMKSYLLRKDGEIIERPQYLYMRVSLGIHGDDIDAAIKSYSLMSARYFGHATPTMFNAGTKFPQLASCFLLDMHADSISGIYKTLADCATISKYAGGIGLSISKIRSKGSFIKGTNGTSNGIVPMCKVFNETAQYCDQGGGKRKGGFALYISPWHADIVSFLDLKKNHGVESERARDLFYALWISDLFMKRVKEGKEWSLFCPNTVPGLCDTYGTEFEKIYEDAELKGLANMKMPARTLWHIILTSTIETGTPYILFKDACNSKSNQKNLGVIKSSNLCAEIVQFTSPEETAVCNLASVALPRFVDCDGIKFDILRDVVHVAIDNLNKVIDRGFYPTPEGRRSNMKHRPVGLGVSGFHDCLFKLGFPWDSKEALKFNNDIFECIYYSALEKSCELAKKHGAYASFDNSPASKGILQFDMWTEEDTVHSGRYNWKQLKEDIIRHGIRNSLLTALMPTASSSQILGVCEGIDPLTSNLYVRRILSGEFIVVNRYLQNDLIKRGLWTQNIRDLLEAKRGSVQKLPGIPLHLKEVYKTSFEVLQKASIDMSAGRGKYIDQSQSLNLFFHNVDHAKLTSAHFHAHAKGLKTSQYYLRTSSDVNAMQATVTEKTRKQLKKMEEEQDCLMCSA